MFLSSLNSTQKAGDALGCASSKPIASLEISEQISYPSYMYYLKKIHE